VLILPADPRNTIIRQFTLLGKPAMLWSSTTRGGAYPAAGPNFPGLEEDFYLSCFGSLPSESTFDDHFEKSEGIYGEAWGWIVRGFGPEPDLQKVLHELESIIPIIIASTPVHLSLTGDSWALAGISGV
jgi:hypothetical protein